MAAGRRAAAAAGPALVSSLLNLHLEMLMKKKTKKNVVFEEQAEGRQRASTMSLQGGADFSLTRDCGLKMFALFAE